MDQEEPKAIVLLHGFPFNRSMWREQSEFLTARGYRVLAPDLRGLGESTVFAEVATMADLGRDVASLMDQANVARAIICGLSMGCYVAFEFIHLFPGRTEALILCGPRAQGPDDAEKNSREAQAQRALDEGMDFAVESISTKLLAQQTVAEKPEVIERVRAMVLSTDPRGAAAAQRGMAGRRDYSAELRQIQLPTLIIAGDEDGVRSPEDAKFIHERIDGSQLITIQHAGHLMNLEQPQTFNETLRDFLQGLAS
jgi:pimeloyl-ACP methyl ester carboxylesterase